MTDPYYPRSKLSLSIIRGYYLLFYVYGIIFCVVYPILNYLETGNFLEESFLQKLKFNLYSVVTCFLCFSIWTLLSMCIYDIFDRQMMARPSILFKGILCLLPFLQVVAAFYIVRNYSMYFTDRIFIVVISWSYVAKAISYYFDTLRNGK